MATLTPAGESRRLFNFLKELNRPAKPRERTDYLPDWTSFNSVFQTHLAPATSSCLNELDIDLDHKLEECAAPELLLNERIVRSIQLLDAERSEFDVLFIYLPERWANAFYGPNDFDLHHQLKAFTAGRRIPIQIVREGSALAYRCRASVMWRIGLALYAKAGGVPWRLADVMPDTAYIGISYALRPMQSAQPRFVTCCSQIFNADGAGLEFLAYDTTEVDVQRENPFLSQTEMFRVLTRSLDVYRRRHGGRSPTRVMVHKSTEFKDAEINGSFEALKHCEAVDLVQVVEDVGWQAVRWEKTGNQLGSSQADRYPVKRGTLLGLSGKDALLWMHGTVDSIGSRPYFQGGRSTPRPIRLVRHAGHGPWDDTARAALALSKMNWNNDGLYDPLPVTMSYAKTLAQVIKRMPAIGKGTFQFRFFI
ncbi:hypothetical protein MKK84_32420 [Methylobacterium sp. E-065]|uniref:argonaute/piwi family protein n=1 Tax=Methylobacterium sp. E-065 TaxID=2836583 RepID=UPI001FBB88F2|nr:hypothetical protein [Methylobacterium sp. E-065]MCJ2022057.1 hypothetical protein [Methylobacterium sp. E-065]